MEKINFSLIDTKSLSKPLSKLIEAVRSGIGILHEPKRIREKAKAEADAQIILAKAHNEVTDIAYRAYVRINEAELRRQNNIESIVSKSVQSLPERVDDSPVDKDWINQFFDCCKDVSNETMQTLWGRLLAGEVAKPGKFSMRTIQMVKTLSQGDANLFTLFCRYIWSKSSNSRVFIKTDEIDEYLKSKKLFYAAFVVLENIGLISMGDHAHKVDPSGSTKFVYFDKNYSFVPKNPIPTFFACYIVSPVGCELAPLSGATADTTYVEVVKRSLDSQGISLSE